MPSLCLNQRNDMLLFLKINVIILHMTVNPFFVTALCSSPVCSPFPNAFHTFSFLWPQPLCTCPIPSFSMPDQFYLILQSQHSSLPQVSLSLLSGKGEIPFCEVCLYRVIMQFLFSTYFGNGFIFCHTPPLLASTKRAEIISVLFSAVCPKHLAEDLS